MKNIRDNTFLIPIRTDSIVRIENILLVTQFLIAHFDTNIRVLECALHNNGLLEKLLDKAIQYDFLEDNDPILFRTKYINQMVREAETPFVAIWDTDVIISVDQIINAVELLRNGKADFVYPYEKQFLDTTPIIRKMFLHEGNIEILEQNTKKMKKMYLPNPLGGAFLANAKSYKESGLENEDFYGWGGEDGERYYRWENLGYKVKQISGPLFHLSHPRGINSVFHNVDQNFFKNKEVRSIARNINISSSNLTV